MITVVAALILRDDRLLICQRKKNDKFALKWEFPGGKVRVGESFQNALRRELREELGVESTIGKEIYRTQHRYAQHADELELVFFSADISTGSVRNLSFEQILWCEPIHLSNYDFLPADCELISLIAAGGLVIT